MNSIIDHQTDTEDYPAIEEYTTTFDWIFALDGFMMSMEEMNWHNGMLTNIKWREQVEQLTQLTNP